MSQRNLYYDLPVELQSKIQIFRPRHPVAQIAAENIRPYNVSTGGFSFNRQAFPAPYKPWGHYPSDRLKHHYLPGEGLIYKDDTLVTEGMRGVGM